MKCFEVFKYLFSQFSKLVEKKGKNISNLINSITKNKTGWDWRKCTTIFRVLFCDRVLKCSLGPILSSSLVFRGSGKACPVLPCLGVCRCRYFIWIKSAAEVRTHALYEFGCETQTLPLSYHASFGGCKICFMDCNPKLFTFHCNPWGIWIEILLLLNMKLLLLKKPFNLLLMLWAATHYNFCCKFSFNYNGTILLFRLGSLLIQLCKC